MTDSKPESLRLAAVAAILSSVAALAVASLYRNGWPISLFLFIELVLYTLLLSRVWSDNCMLDNHEEWCNAMSELRQEIMKTHRSVILRKHAELVCRDEFGDMDWSKFSKWIRQSLVQRKLSDDFPHVIHLAGVDNVVSMALDLAVDMSRKNALESDDARRRIDIDSMTGDEFEVYVSNCLVGHGWKAEVTRGSGDQGVDVVAYTDDLSVAIQCKLHSRPVGNSSVQQAAAGRTHYGCLLAAVVSASGFTRSAIELAQSTNVMLLGPDRLAGLKSLAKSRVKQNGSVHSHSQLTDE